MTYCLGILTTEGLVMASDSRSNAGVDQVAHVSKLTVLEGAGGRVVVILSAGNLATTQSVVTELRQASGSGEADRDVMSANTLFDVTRIIGDTLRAVIDRDAKYVTPYGDPNASFLVGGQIRGEPPRLFQIYVAGNFVEASPRNCFLQIGETKYGKPILDRALTAQSSLALAAKLALVSFDATLRSNLSVGLPIDLLRYRVDSFTADDRVTVESNDAYWRELKDRYSYGLAALVEDLPSPPDPWIGEKRRS